MRFSREPLIAPKDKTAASRGRIRETKADVQQ
jgi:hypothetical protein